MRSSKPVILGGSPLLADEVPLTRPTLTVDEQMSAALGEILNSGSLTKGRHLAALEHRVSEFLGVGHAVAVSSCTSGLILALRCLGLRGEVVLPSFTFMATGHAAMWNGLTPVFADIDPETFGLDPERVDDEITDRTTALLAAHTFGAPCDVEALAKIAATRGIPLVLDAAPGFGGSYPDGSMIGTKGAVEVFSLSPTKPFTTGEGGLITTDDADLARELRIGREYGNKGDYDSAFIGMNARMPELSAALGLHSLPRLPEILDRRRRLADRYRTGLSDVDGIGFQHVHPAARSTYKDVCLTVHVPKFGVGRDTLVEALRAEKVATRTYYDPPLHLQTAYQASEARHGSLPHTEELARTAVTVPLYAHMSDQLVDRICDVIRRIHEHGEEITARKGLS